MSNASVDEVASALQNTRVSPAGVSFQGKSLKLDSEADGQVVVVAINGCASLEYLNLEGNTLGVEAARCIARALEKRPELKRALWKDMFTGRMKTEIPKALESLGNGMMIAGARLRELDLSDNAFGPIGVEGLAALLRSSSCYALEELRLNNNGLGITGGKLLAAALLDCYNCSKKEGKPLALKVFIAGRNRLENEGAKALAEVFKTIGTLQEIAMPQNGIYHVGISALADAFLHNKDLEIINLNDNTIGPKGSQHIAKVLLGLNNLKELNFGDCLLKTKGALLLAESLRDTNKNLEILVLSFNEIRAKGGVELVKAMAGKAKLKNLLLDGNQFGNEGRSAVKSKMKEVGKLNCLGSLSEDESEGSDEEEGEGEEGDEEGESEKEEGEVEEVGVVAQAKCLEKSEEVTVGEFLEAPSDAKLLALGEKRNELLVKEAKRNLSNDIDSYVNVVMNVSAFAGSSNEAAKNAALKCTEVLYKELFTWCTISQTTSEVNNSILVHLGLIKSEDKKFKPTWNVEGCLKALETVVQRNYVPEATKSTLSAFMARELRISGKYLDTKKRLLSLLN